MARKSTLKRLSKKYEFLLDLYRREQEQLGYVSHTVLSRTNQLHEFLSWLEQEGLHDVDLVSCVELKRYYVYLEARPNKNKEGISLSYRSIQSHLRVVAGLFSLLQRNKKVGVHPFSSLPELQSMICKNVKREKRDSFASRSALSKLEIRSLYEVSEREVERALLSLAYGCGLRVSELVGLNVEDVKLRNGLLVVRKGKGNKRRLIPMSEGVKKDLQSYYYGERDAIKKENEQAFMLHDRGGRMQKYTCNKHLKELIARTRNLDLSSRGISLHHLRHSIASHLLADGLSMNQVRMFLGHDQLESTQVYTHVRSEQLQSLTYEDL